MIKSKKKYLITIDQKYCTGCGNCIEFCPFKVLESSSHINQKGIYPPVVTNLEACTGCSLCELYCANFSISVVEENDKEKG
ncbi:ferredoxin family protein [Chloroflexota bacterium]